MDVYALFSDCTAEKIIIDTFPKKESETGLIVRTTISSLSLKESAESSIKNAYTVLEKHYVDPLGDIAICVYGFSQKVIGSSADLAYALSFAAYLLEYEKINSFLPLPLKIAATGSIDERLNVRYIKEIKKKIIAAAENKIDTIFIPDQNYKEFQNILDCDESFQKLVSGINIIPIKTLEEMFYKLGIIDIDKKSPSARTPNKKKIALLPLTLVALISIVATLLTVQAYFNKPSNEDIERKTMHFSRSGSNSYTSLPASTPITTSTPLPSYDTKHTTSPNSTQATPMPKPTDSPFTSSSSPVSTSNIPNTANTVIPTKIIKTNTIETNNSLKNGTEKPNTFGNSTSNLLNAGFASIQGNRIYYTDNLDVGLFSSFADGSHKKSLCNSFAAYINVVGDYVFFINKQNNTLYRIGLDGNNLTKLNDDNMSMISVKDNWIYYISTDTGKIFKLDIHGFDRTPLCIELNYNDTKLKNFTCSNINAHKNSIFFHVDSESNPEIQGIYRMNTDGSNKVQISAESCKMLTLFDNFLYFINPSEDKLYRIDLDGTNKQRICDANIKTFNTSSGWIYYSNSNGIYKTDLTGEFNIKICNDSTDKIDIVDNWIYYLNSKDGNRLYKVKTNGKNKQQIE